MTLHHNPDDNRPRTLPGRTGSAAECQETGFIDPSVDHLVLTNGSYENVIDGSILTLRRLVEHLRRRGTRVSILCSAGGDASSQDPGVFSLPSIPAPFQKEYRLPVGLTAAARQTVRSGERTLIHVAAPDTLGLMMLRQARKLGLPIVTSFHSNIPAYFRYLSAPRMCESLMWSYFRWFYRHFDQIYVPTPSMATELRDQGIRGNLLLWPRGVDVERFTPHLRDPELRKSLGASAEDVIVIFAARLKWEKGLRTLAAVMEDAHTRCGRIRSVVAGDGVALAQLRAMMPKTHFTGALPQSDLARFYASADVFLYPSETDTFGNVTLEAMASGLPVVCADAPGSRSLVDHGHSGLCVPECEQTRFVQDLLRLARDESERRRMGRNARKIAQRYSWDRSLALIEQYYRQLLVSVQDQTTLQR